MEDGIGCNEKDEHAAVDEKDVQVAAKVSESEKDNNYLSLEPSHNPVLKAITRPIIAVKKFCRANHEVIRKLIYTIVSLGVTIYMAIALERNLNRAIPLLVIWCLVVAYKVFTLVRYHYGDKVTNALLPSYNTIAANMFWIKWMFTAMVVVGIAVLIGLDTSKRPKQLYSGLGYLLFMFMLFVTSKHPDQVRWRPVLWGCFIQIVFGLLILRTTAGFEAFNWLGNLVQTFINYIDSGVVFVFGNAFAHHYFAFKVLSIVLYFSAFISMLYYLGAMQWVICKIAWVMHISLTTSATESLVAAGNIFIGQTESPLLIRPYLKDLTTSELHAVMTSGFGTIAAGVLGAYLSFGIDPIYVITACVMAAPCSLAVSKLVYPEIQKSKFTTIEGLMLKETEQRNIIEAISVGVSQAIPLVLNIACSVIVFLGFLAAFNGFLGWFGGLVDFPELSFELICSYVFMPVTFLMGIDWTNCFKAAELIGTKIILNEFIAYEKLAAMNELRDNGTIPRIDPVTGETNWIDERSEAIVTYALCGFANFGSIGIQLGGLGEMAPHRKGEMAEIVIRALFSGVFVSILNACVAGFLYYPRPIACTNILSTDRWTNTEIDRLFECCSTVLPSGSPASNATINCCNYDWPNKQFQDECAMIG